MPNQNNYKQALENAEAGYSRYIISRIISNPADTLLVGQLPSALPFDLDTANVEISLYSLADNSLIYSDYISNSIVGALTQKNIEYQTNKIVNGETTKIQTVRTFLFIDFSKLVDLGIPSGQYSLTLNFFVDEVGSYQSRPLSISKISPSRLEIEFDYNGDSKEQLDNFIKPSIGNSTLVLNSVINQVLNDTGSYGQEELPTNNIRLTPEVIRTLLPTNIARAIDEYQFDTGSTSVYSVAQEILNSAIDLWYEGKITIPAKYNAVNYDRDAYYRFTQDVVTDFIVTAVSSSYVNYLSNNENRIKALPYDLVVSE